jgi:hypothetical protein
MGRAGGLIEAKELHSKLVLPTDCRGRCAPNLRWALGDWLVSRAARVDRAAVIV